MVRLCQPTECGVVTKADCPTVISRGKQIVQGFFVVIFTMSEVGHVQAPNTTATIKFSTDPNPKLRYLVLPTVTKAS